MTTPASPIAGRFPKAGATDVPAISIRELDFAVANRRGGRTEILHDVNLAVALGEFVAIVGPSGCGKSTLLNFVAGLLTASSGTVEVFGAPPAAGTARIGYMFQTHALQPWRSVLRNVELGLEIVGVDKAGRSARAGAMLERVGLAGYADHYPSELSGGMRQRAALARTLVAGPQILLMDEPFGALDAQTKVLIHDLFLQTWEADRPTVLFVTHDLAEAIALADRVLVMGARPGRIIAEHAVRLPRPRDVQKLHNAPRFNELLDQLWGHLRIEAERAMRGAE